MTPREHQSVFRQTSTPDKRLLDGLLAVRKSAPASIDRPSCFIWDVGVAAGVISTA